MKEIMLEQSQRTYLPAAGRDSFLPLYDLLTKLTGADQARKVLLGQAHLRAGQRVLDVGCGTGTLAVLIKRLYPRVIVVGLDPDPRALARARRKAKRAALSVRFDQGFSDELPYAEASFDRVFSSFMLHHLQPGEKQRTLREVWRVLQPGGSLHLLDFVGPKSGANGFLAHFVHSSQHLKDNAEDRILTLMRQANFHEPRVTGRQTVLFGHADVVYYKGAVPTSKLDAAAC